VEIAQGFGLNPFKREIYANKYGNNFSVIVGYETYIKRAERSGLLSGWSVKTDGTVNFQKPKESTLRAEITIHRRDFQHPFIHEVYFSEYFGTTKEGALNKFWGSKPMTMIKKVAMAQGFRLCFSDELGGMPYTAEELNTMDADHVVIEDKPKRTSSKYEQKKEITIQVEPTPETLRDEINNLAKAIGAVKDAKNMEELRTVWMQFQNLQGNPDFKKLVNDRKAKLSAEIEPTNDIKSEDEMIKLIEGCNTESEVLELTADEKRRDVLDAALDRITRLSETAENGGSNE
jgi:phage recombination protein Bet